MDIGTDQIIAFLTSKWQREKSYRLRKELFAFTDNKIAVQFFCMIHPLPNSCSILPSPLSKNHFKRTNY
jgi:Protein of unknown function (DUF1348)